MTNWPVAYVAGAPCSGPVTGNADGRWRMGRRSMRQCAGWALATNLLAGQEAGCEFEKNLLRRPRSSTIRRENLQKTCLVDLAGQLLARKTCFVDVRGRLLCPELVTSEPAILAEGEFDTLLLWQEVGDLVGVATLGSCSRV